MQERKIIQIGFVVRDLDRSLEGFHKVLGAGSWDIYRYEPPEMTNITYRGKPADWSADVAFCWVGDRQIEVIMPLKGPNIYEEFLARKGDGIHHIKEWVEDPRATVEEYAKKGIGVIQSGTFCGGDFFYLDTEAYLGMPLELSKSGGRKKREPDRRWPAAGR
jgi:catechol 2,3-dioxygenase-like lactoylglutathione lyase family enzyme